MNPFYHLNHIICYDYWSVARYARMILKIRLELSKKKNNVFCIQSVPTSFVPMESFHMYMYLCVAHLYKKFLIYVEIINILDL